MTATKPLGTYGDAAGAVTPLDHKMAQSGLIVKTSTVNLVRAGVFYNGNASLITGKANMSFDVGAFSAALTRGASAGTVLLTNDGTLNVTTTAAPGSNSRIDIIYAWAREYSLDGVDSNPVIGVVQGTAAASPVAPSLAAFPGAIELGRATIPSGITATTSATITQTAPFTSMHGGKVEFRTTTEMNLWTTAIVDQQALDLSTGVSYRYNGSAWKAWESDWISYNPTLTNITEGAAVKTARYKYTDGRCAVEGRWQFGAGSAVGSGPRIAHPVTADATSSTVGFPLGMLNIYDTGTAYYQGVLIAESTTNAYMFVAAASGSYASPTAVTAAIPITFATGDVLTWKYEFTPA